MTSKSDEMLFLYKINKTKNFTCIDMTICNYFQGNIMIVKKFQTTSTLSYKAEEGGGATTRFGKWGEERHTHALGLGLLLYAFEDHT